MGASAYPRIELSGLTVKSPTLANRLIRESAMPISYRTLRSAVFIGATGKTAIELGLRPAPALAKPKYPKRTAIVSAPTAANAITTFFEERKLCADSSL